MRVRADSGRSRYGVAGTATATSSTLPRCGPRSPYCHAPLVSTVSPCRGPLPPTTDRSLLIAVMADTGRLNGANPSSSFADARGSAERNSRMASMALASGSAARPKPWPTGPAARSRVRRSGPDHNFAHLHRLPCNRPHDNLPTTRRGVRMLLGTVRHGWPVARRARPPSDHPVRSVPPPAAYRHRRISHRYQLMRFAHVAAVRWRRGGKQRCQAR